MSITNYTTAINSYQNATGLAGLFQTTDAVLGHMFGMILWLMIIGTMFVALKVRGFDTSDAFASCSFVGFILCIFLRYLSIIPEIFFYASIVAFAVSGVFLVVSRNQY